MHLPSCRQLVDDQSALTGKKSRRTRTRVSRMRLHTRGQINNNEKSGFDYLIFRLHLYLMCDSINLMFLIFLKSCDRAWRSVATWAIGVGACLCYSVGLAGYLSFRDAVDGDILLNFTGSIASVFKAAVLVHLVLYIPSEVSLSRWRVSCPVASCLTLLRWDREESELVVCVSGYVSSLSHSLTGSHRLTS